MPASISFSVAVRSFIEVIRGGGVLDRGEEILPVVGARVIGWSAY